MSLSQERKLKSFSPIGSSSLKTFKPIVVEEPDNSPDERQSLPSFLYQNLIEKPAQQMGRGIEKIQALGNTSPQTLPADLLKATSGAIDVATSPFAVLNLPIEAASEAIKKIPVVGEYLDPMKHIENVSRAFGIGAKAAAELITKNPGVIKQAEELGQQIGGAAPFIAAGVGAKMMKGGTPFEVAQPEIAKSVSTGHPTMEEIYPSLVEQNLGNVARSIKFNLDNGQLFDPDAYLAQKAQPAEKPSQPIPTAEELFTLPTGEKLPPVNAAQGKIPVQKPGTTFFKQADDVSCGTCATNSVLAMYGKEGDVSLKSEDGTSPKAITADLEKRGIETDPKTVPFDKIEPRSIAYYPKDDHYVSIEKVEPDKLLVNDSKKDGPEWVDKKDFEKNWSDKDGNGWVMSTSEKTSQPAAEKPVTGIEAGQELTKEGKQPWEMEEEEFLNAAEGGVTEPYPTEEAEIIATSEGKKPITLIGGDKESLDLATRHGLIVEKLPKYAAASDEKMVYGAYKPGQRQNFEKLNNAIDPPNFFENLPAGENPKDARFMHGDIAVGRALGYSEKDILSFLQTSYGWEGIVRQAMKEGRKIPTGVARDYEDFLNLPESEPLTRQEMSRLPKTGIEAGQELTDVEQRRGEAAGKLRIATLKHEAVPSEEHKAALDEAIKNAEATGLEVKYDENSKRNYTVKPQERVANANDPVLILKKKGIWDGALGDIQRIFKDRIPSDAELEKYNPIFLNSADIQFKHFQPDAWQRWKDNPKSEHGKIKAQTVQDMAEEMKAALRKARDKGDEDGAQEFTFGVGLGQIFRMPRAPEKMGIPPENSDPALQKTLDNYRERISVGESQKPKTTLIQFLRESYRALVNSESPIERLEKQFGQGLPLGKRPYTLVQRYRGIEGIARSPLFWKTTRLTTEGKLEITGKGLKEILAPVEKNFDDVRTLLIAERDMELAKRGDIKGTTADQSMAVIESLKSKYGKNFDALNKTIVEIRDWAKRAILDPLKDVGVLSSETINSIMSSNEFYTPFQRVMDGLESNGVLPSSSGKFQPKKIPIYTIKGSTRRIIDPLESLITMSQKVTNFVERERVVKAIVDMRSLGPELEKMIEPINNIRPAPKDALTVFENGKKKFYLVPDDLRKAIDGMRPSEINVVQKILSFPTRLLRAGATLTPEFIARNPLRDQFSAFVYSKHGYIPGVDLMRGLFDLAKNPDKLQEFYASGAGHSMFVSLDRASSQATLKSLMGHRDWKDIAKSIFNPLPALQKLSESMELATRIGAYERVTGKDLPQLEAMSEARELTLDFSRAGNTGRALNSMIAFWNANIQGTDKLVRAMKERPLQTTAKAALGITFPSVALWMMNHNDPEYQEIPQWQKDLFWLVKVKNSWVRIPKPFELGIVFGTSVEHVLDFMKDHDPESLKNIVDAVMAGATPGVLPTAITPIVENYANYDFFRKRHIIPTYREDLPPELQYGDYTSEVSKLLGSKLKVSPSKLDHLITGYGAGLANVALTTVDETLRRFNLAGIKTQTEMTSSDVPLLRAFSLREPIGSQSESVNKFYDLYKRTAALQQAFNERAKRGEDPVKLLHEYPEVMLASTLQKIGSSFGKIMTAREVIKVASNMTPARKTEEIRKLDVLLTNIAKEIVGSTKVVLPTLQKSIETVGNETQK